MKTTQIAIIRRLVKFGHLPWNTMVAVKKKNEVDLHGKGHLKRSYGKTLKICR